MVMSQPSRSASASKLQQLHVWLDWKDGSAEDVTSPSADISDLEIPQRLRTHATDGGTSPPFRRESISCCVHAPPQLAC